MGRKRTIWERVEPVEAFLERKTQGKIIKKATPNEVPESTVMKKKESKLVRLSDNKSNTKTRNTFSRHCG